MKIGAKWGITWENSYWTIPDKKWQIFDMAWDHLGHLKWLQFLIQQLFALGITLFLKKYFEKWGKNVYEVEISIKLEMLVKIEILVENPNFGKKNITFGQTSKFWSKMEILLGIEILRKNRKFVCQKSKFWSKI